MNRILEFPVESPKKPRPVLHLLYSLGRVADMYAVSLVVASTAIGCSGKAPVRVPEAISDGQETGQREAGGACCYRKRAQQQVCFLQTSLAMIHASTELAFKLISFNQKQLSIANLQNELLFTSFLL